MKDNRAPDMKATLLSPAVTNADPTAIAQHQSEYKA